MSNETQKTTGDTVRKVSEVGMYILACVDQLQPKIDELQQAAQAAGRSKAAQNIKRYHEAAPYELFTGIGKILLGLTAQFASQKTVSGRVSTAMRGFTFVTEGMLETANGVDRLIAFVEMAIADIDRLIEQYKMEALHKEALEMNAVYDAHEEAEIVNNLYDKVVGVPKWTLYSPLYPVQEK